MTVVILLLLLLLLLLMMMISPSRFILARMVTVWKLFSFLLEHGDSDRTIRAEANGNEIFS
jgi:hypothetical protein